MANVPRSVRKLNAVTIPFPSAVTLISDVLDAISEAKIFSKMDMIQGFLQLRLAEESMKKTAFTCYKGVFEYGVGALGMTNVPPYFLIAVSNVCVTPYKCFRGPKEDCKNIF